MCEPWRAFLPSAVVGLQARRLRLPFLSDQTIRSLNATKNVSSFRSVDGRGDDEEQKVKDREKVYQKSAVKATRAAKPFEKNRFVIREIKNMSRTRKIALLSFVFLSCSSNF